MEPVIIFVGILIAVFIASWLHTLRHAKMMAIANEDSAFDGPVDLDSLTPARVAEIRDLVDRVGVVKTGVDERGGRSSKQRAAERFEVFLIDVEGAIHEIGYGDTASQAAELAREVARRLDVPLDETNHVLAGY